jgi:hypothetical protein
MPGRLSFLPIVVLVGFFVDNDNDKEKREARDGGSWIIES